MKQIINNNTQEEYRKLIPKYEKLGLNIAQALELLLKEKDIPTLSISYRVKDINSFEKKN